MNQKTNPELGDIVVFKDYYREGFGCVSEILDKATFRVFWINTSGPSMANNKDWKEFWEVDSITGPIRPMNRFTWSLEIIK